MHYVHKSSKASGWFKLFPLHREHWTEQQFLRIAMNRFTNDGSFMQQFSKPKQQARSPHNGLKNDSMQSTADAHDKKPIAAAGLMITAKSAFSSSSDGEEEETGTVAKPQREKSTPAVQELVSTASLNDSTRYAAPMITKTDVTDSSDAKKARKRSRWDAAEQETVPLSATITSQPSTPALTSQQQQILNQIISKQQQKQQQPNRRKNIYSTGKREYDSDEEIDAEFGTWEHKRRLEEMQKTQATPRTHQHLGSYIPAEELQKVLPKRFRGGSNSQQQPEQPTVVEPLAVAAVADDKNSGKLDESNVGFKLLAKMGWKDGTGLGAASKGISEPISAGTAETTLTKAGLGLNATSSVAVENHGGEEVAEDEFELYRKRMQLAYKHRPNPLNNPRRQYY